MASEKMSVQLSKANHDTKMITKRFESVVKELETSKKDTQKLIIEVSVAQAENKCLREDQAELQRKE